MLNRREVGQVVKIDLYNGYHTYGCELDEGLVAVAEMITQEDKIIEATVFSPSLFIVPFLDINSSGWKKLGRIDLGEINEKRPEFFVQDSIDLSIEILENSGQLRSVSFEEAKSLERESLWYAFEIEQRVRDYFAGKTNVTHEYLRPKPPNSPHYSASTPYTTKPGTIKQIPLGDGTYVYARELSNTFLAVYDSRTEDTTLPSDITQKPVLFTTSATLSARIGWKSVGFIPLKEVEHPLPIRYQRIGSKPTDFLIYNDPYDPDFKSIGGTVEDARGLEPVVMWDNYHVENRIRAYYQGDPWQFGVD